jgi:hypothetical protein
MINNRIRAVLAMYEAGTISKKIRNKMLYYNRIKLAEINLTYETQYDLDNLIAFEQEIINQREIVLAEIAEDHPLKSMYQNMLQLNYLRLADLESQKTKTKTKTNKRVRFSEPEESVHTG